MTDGERLERLKRARRAALDLTGANISFKEIAQSLVRDGHDPDVVDEAIHSLMRDKATAKLDGARGGAIYALTLGAAGIVFALIETILWETMPIGGLLLLLFGGVLGVRAGYDHWHAASFLRTLPRQVGAGNSERQDVTDLRDDKERLSDEVTRARTIARIERHARISGFVVWGICAIALFQAWGETAGDWLLPIVGFAGVPALLAAYALRWIMFRAERIDKVPFFGHRVQALQAAVAYDVPRHKGIKAPSDLSVIRAPLQQSNGVNSGGASPLPEFDAGRYSTGILICTERGLAFLPNADSQNVLTLRDAASAAFEIAKERIPLFNVLWKPVFDIEADIAKSIPAWIEEVLRHRHVFVIPWFDLVAAAYQPDKARVLLTREWEDGRRAQFALAMTDPKVPMLLLAKRLIAEIEYFYFEHVTVPRVATLIPELTEKFKAIYGERYVEHGAEIVAEVHRQATADGMDKMKALEIAAKELAALAPFYRRIPEIAKGNPEFFTLVDAQDSAQQGFGF
jgi:hypothetical protein